MEQNPETQEPQDETALDRLDAELDAHGKGEKRRKFGRFTLAALGGIPWVGGFLGANAALDAEKEQGRVNELHRQWLDEHRKKIEMLAQTLSQILDRLDSFGEEIEERIESPHYLALVQRGFRTWDQADTDEKRDLVRMLLTNACATKMCPDDLVRLFLDWIDTYHEAHFRVIREVHANQGITRGRIWDGIGGERPREDSAEADVYKLLVRDLTIGGVIRQQRETDGHGRYKAKPSGGRRSGSGVLKSAFDDVEPYELTELGRQFVHYTMNEVVPRIEGSDATE